MDLGLPNPLFFQSLSQSQFGVLKKPLFEAWAGTNFTAKTVCQTGLPGNASQQRKRYTTPRESSQRSSRVNLGLGHARSAQLTLGRTSEMTSEGGVPFSLLACIPWEACLAHRFHRKIPKIAKKCPKVQKKPFLHVFYLDSAYTFRGCQPKPQKVVFFTPNWEGL